MVKMKLYSFWFIIGIIPVLMASCMHSKDQVSEEERIPEATITFLSPSNGAVLSLNDSVSIQAQAISTDPLHGYDLVIRKANDTTTYLFAHFHEHEGDTLDIDKKWKGNLQDATNMEAMITVYLDHELHTKWQKVTFRLE